MGLARKMGEEYNIAGSVVEQAISSIRTVYSFVGESKTLNNFSRTLEGSLKLGLKQGLVKGIAIGSNGITFAIWAFMSWYSSRLVMHHRGEGGTIFAVGVLIIISGM
ncbi:ABC-type xenobiotic transporter [Ranunculus cassubicifolius]